MAHNIDASSTPSQNVLYSNHGMGNGTSADNSPRNEAGYEVPQDWTNIDEIAASGNQRDGHTQNAGPRSNVHKETHSKTTASTGLHVSKTATQVYTISYLIFFSLLGTLARLGLTALTTYQGAPVAFTVLWSNVGGSLIMGFLIEDRKLFRHEWGASEPKKSDDAEFGSETAPPAADLPAVKKAHLAAKKTIPLYVGLATGFCGSFTSFSSFIRDVFLAISNDLHLSDQPPPGQRNGGYSFMAMLAVIITTVSLSLSAMTVGSHLAIAVERITPSIPFRVTRKALDPITVVLSCGCWLGAIFLAIFPPHNSWRGQVVFSLVFAPLGCLCRFYLALYLNGRFATFPLGTFAANILGTAVLGMAWNISHVPVGGVVGCQVLQGVEDGFCGCLTTVSTWVSELKSLKRRNSWMYGSVSVTASLLLLIAIMGGLRWSDGFHGLVCQT